MLYLKPGEKITAEAIAKRYDDRATVKAGYLENVFVFQVEVWGGVIGYIAPPTSGSGVWGINLTSGAREVSGYFREILVDNNNYGGYTGVISDPENISTQTIIEEGLVWDLEYFAPLTAA